MLEAFDAELTVLHRERRLIHAGDRDEGREIGTLARQVLGELEAGARRSRIRVDGIVEQPETVVLAQALVLLPHVGDLAHVERDPQRVERRAPQGTVGIAARDHHQAVRLLGGVAGAALVGDVSGGSGALQELRLLAIVARPHLHFRLGEPQPVGAVVGRDHGELPEDLHAAAEIVALERGVGLAPQGLRRLGDLAGLALDLGFELDGRVDEVVALERLVGGNGWNGQQQDERGCSGSANEREHGVFLQFPLGGESRTGRQRMNVKTCRGRDRSSPAQARADPSQGSDSLA